MIGTDTTSTFLEWSTLFLIKYPDIQEKLYQEIKTNIGTRAANITDKPSTPLVECFLEEVFRCCHFLDLAIPHRVVKDVTFRGYLFPKDTQIIADMDAVNHDPKYWKDPDTFYPERFLNEEGKFKSDPRLMPFGIGKRRCMGEILARCEIYLFIVGLIQNFEMKRVSEPCFDPIPGMICYPKEFEAELVSRN